ERFNCACLIVDLGFTTAKPLKQFIDHLSGTGNLFYFFTIQGYWVAYWLIVLAFLFVALHLMLTIIEYQLAVLAGTVLIPWGVLGAAALFSGVSIWLRARGAGGGLGPGGDFWLSLAAVHHVE